MELGIDYTIENGKYVFTSHYLLKRGYCCHFGCRNCPYTKDKNMEKDLFINDKVRPVVIQHDDLKFDGKSMIIPGYWASNIAEYLNNLDDSKISEADKEDLELFKSFIYDIEYNKTQGN